MLNEHHQTATCMNSTSIVSLSMHGAADQARAHPDPRLSDRPPARSAALRRGALDHRRDLARPARHGLHQGRAVRVRAVERQSGRRDGPLLGVARLHHQGDDHARRPVQLGERALPLPAGEHLAAAVAAAASAGLEHDRQQDQRARARRARLRDGDPGLGLRHQGAVRRLSRRLRVDAQRRDAGPRPLRLSRAVRDRAQRDRSAPARRAGRRLSAHRRQRLSRRSRIRPAISRSTTT